MTIQSEQVAHSQLVGGLQTLLHSHPGGGGVIGIATIDFGAFPGKPEVSLAITGQAGILSTSIVKASLRAQLTSDHSVDEHRVENIKVFPSDIVVGTGFTIYTECLLGYQLYGQWSIDWSWV